MYSHPGMPATDVHQHLWPEPLLGLLAARAEAPRLRRRGTGWELELAGEPAAPFDPRAHDPGARARRSRATDEIERILVAPSSPLGIETLPDAQPLLDAFHDGVRALGEPFFAWGSIALAAAEPAAVDALLDSGAAGLCLPAHALAGPRQLDRVGPVLERLGRAPRAAVRASRARRPTPAAPDARVVAGDDLVRRRHAGRLARAGRPGAGAAHPRLQGRLGDAGRRRAAARRAPCRARRTGRRGATTIARGSTSPRTAPRAVDAMLRVVGVDRLVLGSDRPVADPQPLASLGPAVRHAVANVNPSDAPRDHAPDRRQSTSPRTSSSASCATSPPSPSAGAHLVAHRPDERTYAELHRDDDVAVWLICWMNDHDTGYHDHDLSAGAVAVAPARSARSGSCSAARPPARTAAAGEAFTFGAGRHPPREPRRRRAGRDRPRVLAAAVADGRLRGLPTGELRRWSLSYAEELAPDRGIERARSPRKLPPGRGRRGESGSEQAQPLIGTTAREL